MKNRYDNIHLILDTLAARGDRHLQMIEVGTYNGTRASQIVNRWLSQGKEFSASYHGFDLFEHTNETINKQELSKTKLPPSRLEVVDRLRAAIGNRFELHAGNTKETLTRFADNWVKFKYPHQFNFIFIDGGHSLETIASDWAAIAKLMTPETIVLFDDYYLNREDFGCKIEIEKIMTDSKYHVQLLDPVDHFDHTNLDIRMVMVTLR